jgi:hypothetical protein
MRDLAFAIAFLVIMWPSTIRLETTAPDYVVDTSVLDLHHIPPRPALANSGWELVERIAGLRGSEREAKILAEIRRGNVPEFLRDLKQVHLSLRRPGRPTLSATIWVMPDYLSVGTDEEFVRVPMTFDGAVRVAGEFGMILPTRKIVDAVHAQSDFRLKPQPMKPGPLMSSTAYFVTHNARIEQQLAGRPRGELISGHKKDVVLTNRLLRRPRRVAIYGWHRLSGEPIQPLSLAHQAAYADYSHGLRLVSAKALVEGVPTSILKALSDPELAPLFSYEGAMQVPVQLRVNDLASAR